MIGLIICWDKVSYLRELLDDDIENISEYYKGVPIINFHTFFTKTTFLDLKFKNQIDDFLKELRENKINTVLS